MSVMLYYPWINPSRSALYRSLLYWDGIASVAPGGDSLLNEDMVRTRDAGLFHPLSLNRIQDACMGVIESPLLLAEIENLYPPGDLLAIGDHDEYEEVGNKFRPEPRPDRELEVLDYGGKGLDNYGEDFRQQLLDRRLIKTVEEGRRVTYLASTAFQRLLLTLMVRQCAARGLRLVDGRFIVEMPYSWNPWDSVAAAEHNAGESIPVVPYTDDPEAHRLALSGLSRAVSPCWQVELAGVLPAPSEHILIADLLSFRKKHEDERRRLVLAVDRLAAELGSTYAHPQDAWAAARTEIELARKDLDKAAKAHKIRWMQRSLALTVATGSAAAVSADPRSPANWVLATIGAIAVNVTSATMRSPIPASPYSYLARVDKAVA